MDHVLLSAPPWRPAALRCPGSELPLTDDLGDPTAVAAAKVSAVFRRLCDRTGDPDAARWLVSQIVVSLFAEDVGLLPDGMMTQILRDCVGGASASELIGGLFRQMNDPRPAPAGRYRNVAYFDGGLFAIVAPIELTAEDAAGLVDAAAEDWARVQPAILGALLEQSLAAGDRHAFGVHFTDEADIQRVIVPTIVAPWRRRIAAARTLEALLAVRQDLASFRVLDPACGSGNFLYVAYRALKRLETELLLEIHRRWPTRRVGAGPIVRTTQLYGIDCDPFAVALARVTLAIARELAAAETSEVLSTQLPGLALEPERPPSDLDSNIVVQDALLTDWPEVDCIIGNPPFQSKTKAQKELGRGYMNSIRARFSEVPGRADYCVYWFHKAHDVLQAGGRAGLVGTNSIRRNDSRVGGLDHIVGNGGTIVEAATSQPWSGDAAVHVSIVSWVKGSDDQPKRLFVPDDRGGQRVIETPRISASLTAGPDVALAQVLRANTTKKRCFQGQTHGHDGFLVDRAEAEAMIGAEPLLEQVLHPFLIGRELVAIPGGLPTRYVIDFADRTVFEASEAARLFERVQRLVRPDRQRAAAEEQARNAEARAKNAKARINRHHTGFLDRWWQLSYRRAKMLAAIGGAPRYIACSRISKHPIFAMVDRAVRPNDKLQVFALWDDYSFGIISSGYHWRWVLELGQPLGVTPSYTSGSVWDTFPWPQAPAAASVQAVAACARAVRAARCQLASAGLTFRRMYELAAPPGTNALAEAHEALDAAVAAAYGFGAGHDELGSVLELNGALAAEEAAGAPVVGPGLPPGCGDDPTLISEDAIRLRP